MTILKTRILKNVCLNLEQKTIEILWVNRITEGGLVIAESNHRKIYSSGEKSQLLADIPEAANLPGVIGWEVQVGVTALKLA